MLDGHPILLMRNHRSLGTYLRVPCVNTTPSLNELYRQVLLFRIKLFWTSNLGVQYSNRPRHRKNHKRCAAAAPLLSGYVSKKQDQSLYWSSVVIKSIKRHMFDFNCFGSLGKNLYNMIYLRISPGGCGQHCWSSEKRRSLVGITQVLEWLVYHSVCSLWSQLPLQASHLN